MEIILALIAIGAVGFFFWQNNKKSVTKTSEASAPYKVETPVPAQDVAPQPVAVAVEGAGQIEIPQEAAPAKKPRKPRAPKAETVAKKPAAKKAATKKTAPKAK
jgi:hypothetical protein